MSGRLAVLVGLLAGLVTAGVIFAVALMYAPQIAEALYPTPAVPGATVAPTLPPRPSPTPRPSASLAASPSPAGSPTSRPSTSATASGSSAFGIGEEAPALALPLVGGGTVDLADLRGKSVWVNFMATWCEPCRDEFPLMSVFQARYEEQGLVVLAVDVREEEEVVAAFLDQVPGLFQVALDEDGAAQRAWGAIALPIHFWIDTEGIIRDGALGGIGPDTMVEGLQAIMPGVEVSAP